MASMVLRTLLLFTFVCSYLSVVHWYRLDAPISGLSAIIHSTVEAKEGILIRPECDLNWKAPNANENFNDSTADREDLNGFDGRRLLDVNHMPCSQPPTPYSLESSPRTVHLGKSDLFRGSFVLANALTVLDLVLSRRTKPWRFFLRILYRISRSNFKWAVFWLIWMISSQLGSQYLVDQLRSIVLKLASTETGLQIQRAWNTMQYYPFTSTLSFFLYSMVVGWVFRRFLPRSTLNDGRNGGQTGFSGPGLPSDSSVVQSRWSLFMACLFRPVSFSTAQNLADLDFELDDNMELLIERLALPNLWLTPVVPTDYLKYLPVWQFNGWDVRPLISTYSPSCPGGRRSPAADYLRPQVPNCITWNPDQPTSYPTGMIPSHECAICLEKYRSLVSVCGLPCGHHFHHDCIMIWLQRDNHHCPICRWPAYRAKRLLTSAMALSSSV